MHGEDRTSRAVARRPPTTAGGDVGPHGGDLGVSRQVLVLQGIAGNAAVTRLLSRSRHHVETVQRNGGPPAPPPPKNIAVITAKYQKLLKEKQAIHPEVRHLTHKEFMGSAFSESEVTSRDGVIHSPTTRRWAST